MAHLFTYFVGSGQEQGVFWHLPGLLAIDPSPALQASAKSLGLASMAGIEKLPILRRAASEQYCIALRATNAALQDPTLAKCDSTLLAVEILSTYEVKIFDYLLIHS